MGLFRYEAVDKSGRVVHGAMNARDEHQVVQNLSHMGYSARAVHPASGHRVTRQRTTSAPVAQAASVGQGAGIGSVTVASGVPVSIKSSVPVATLAKFFRHLATLVKSGISINQALSEMVGVVRNGRLRAVLPRMQEATHGGRKLSGLMAEYPGVFPVHTIASVWSGELGGRLEVALEEVAADLEQEASDTRYGRIGWFLTKASLIGLVFCIPASNLVNLLSPVLRKTLATTGGMTKQEVLRMVLSEYMKNMFWQSVSVGVALVLLWIVWGFLKRVPTVRRMLDGALLCVPVWGRLHRERAIARFLHVLDGLHSAGISPGAAWDAASLTVRNSAIAERLRLVRTSLSSSVSVSQLCAASGVFDAEDVGIVSSGENAGQLPDVLAHLSASYHGRAAAQKNIGRTWAVALLVLVSIVLTGYIMIRVTQTYFDFAFKAAEMIGQ